MITWLDAAILTKTKGMQGGFAVTATAGLPFLLSEGMEVHLVPPQLDGLRVLTVGSCELTDEAHATVIFNQITSRQQAEAYVGMHCLVDAALVQDAGGAAHVSLIGYTVRDIHEGLLGTVADVIKNPGQDLLEVTADDDGRMIYIPLVDDLLVDCDDGAQVLEFNLPQGLTQL